MRIWSIHPKYLDTKRLTAQWREALLCRKVLEGNTKGYKNHPQFLKIKNHYEPMTFINAYLLSIWEESHKRGFKYDKSKIDLKLALSFKKIDKFYLKVTKNQLVYEYCHLMEKIKNNQVVNDIKENPVFFIVDGDIMGFEKINENTLKTYQNFLKINDI